MNTCMYIGWNCLTRHWVRSILHVLESTVDNKLRVKVTFITTFVLSTLLRYMHSVTSLKARKLRRTCKHHISHSPSLDGDSSASASDPSKSVEQPAAWPA